MDVFGTPFTRRNNCKSTTAPRHSSTMYVAWRVLLPLLMCQPPFAVRTTYGDDQTTLRTDRVTRALCIRKSIVTSQQSALSSRERSELRYSPALALAED